MGILARAFIIFCGFLFFFLIFKLLIRQKISVRNSMVWLVGTFFVLILSIMPNLLDDVAALIGIGYPPALLFLIAILIILYLLLNQSIQISILNARVKELTQNIAIKEAIEQRKKNNQTKNQKNMERR